MKKNNKILALEIAFLCGMLLATVSTVGVVGASGDLNFCDFETPGFTSLGGGRGAMESTTGLITENDVSGGVSGKALKLTYNFSSTQWCGYWMFFKADQTEYNVSGYTHIKMWVKGASGNEIFKLELQDTDGGGSYKTGISVPSTSWTEISISLSDFTKIPWYQEPANLSKLRQINIVFDVAPRNSTVYFDEIRFISGSSPPPPTPSGNELIVDDFNDGSGPNNLGGACGAMGDSGTEISENYVTGAYEGQYALRLTYDRKTSWVGYWTFMKPDQSGYDVSGYENLKIAVKGASATEMKIELEDESGGASYKYINVPASNWSEVTIPLSSFQKIPWKESAADLSDLKQINLVFDKSPSTNTVYVDIIRFVSSSSQGGTTLVYVSPASQQVVGDNAFSVDIKVTPGTAISGMQVSLKFDPSLLSVTSVAEGDLLSQGGSTYFGVIKIDNENGIVTGIYGVVLGSGTVSTPGTFAKIYMKGKMVEGTSQLLLENVIVGDGQGNSVNVSVENGSVTLLPYPDWDVNMDGHVNVLDMIVVIQNWGKTGAPHWIRSDVNRDGKVNVLDMILIGKNWTG
ncbi:MAG: CIA30 family protein [Candidatus Hadarchaeales archaeon]